MTDLPQRMPHAAHAPAEDAEGVGGDRARVIIGLAVFAGVALLLLATRSSLLADPDTQWHIATGRWIMANGWVPHVDMFSHSFAGQPWIAKEWLSQLALHAAHAAGGWSGVTLATALAFAGSLAALAVWLASRLRSTAALTAIALILFLSLPTALARPHIMALPLMLVWLLGMINAADQRRLPHWSMLCVMTLWANAHAGFTIGFVIAGLLGLEVVRAAGPGRWFRTALEWGAFLGLALIAACLSPYGPKAFIVTLNLFGSGEPLTYIREWQPRAMDATGIASVALLLALLAALALNPWRNLLRIVLVALLGWMMLRYGRFALLFAFAALPIAATPLAMRFAALRPEAMAASRARLMQAAAGAAALIGAALIVLPAPAPSPLVTPAAALAAARAAGLAGPVFNSYDFGGYLIAEGVPTFIDGRTDQLFLGGFFHRQEEVLKLDDPAPLLAFIARHDVTWALVRPKSPEAKLLAAAGWAQLHADRHAIVLSKPGL